MKRVPWILVVLAALLIGAALLLREKPIRPEPVSVTETVSSSSVAATPTGSFTPATTDLKVVLPKPSVVDIQDGKTIDFSSGLPLIKDSDKDTAALQRALKEMEEAAAGVSFGAPATPAPEKK